VNVLKQKTFEYGNHYTMKKNRLKVLGAANFTCAICKGEAKQVHHKDGSKSNHNPDNLLPVCRKCHMKIHAAQRARWDVESIEVAMMQRGIDKGELAELTGLTKATITNILKTGATKNSTMKRIADALDYPVEAFLLPGAAEKLDRLEVKAAEISMIKRVIEKHLASVKDPILKRRFHIWITNDIRRKFNVKSYYNIPEDKVNEAVDFVRQWQIPGSQDEGDLAKTGTE
jgi:transcriptional regulator with XRE-family HTH domain